MLLRIILLRRPYYAYDLKIRLPLSCSVDGSCYAPVCRAAVHLISSTSLRHFASLIEVALSPHGLNKRKSWFQSNHKNLRKFSVYNSRLGTEAFPHVFYALVVGKPHSTSYITPLGLLDRWTVLPSPQ